MKRRRPTARTLRSRAAVVAPAALWPPVVLAVGSALERVDTV